MRYLLEVNVFVQAKNLHSGFDFCPAFWDWLLGANENSVLASVDKFADELLAHRSRFGAQVCSCDT